jgi:hypothetical protein
MGTENYTVYLQTDPSTLPLTPQHTYRITFDYRILETPDQGFEILFWSSTGGAQGHFLPSIHITGQAGKSGSATLTNTLGDYTDYEALWSIVGTGAIVIDNIRVVNLTTGQTVATEDAEQLSPSLSPGIHGDINVTTDPAQVIDGSASVLMSQSGTLKTDPDVLPLSGGSTYMIEFDYQILTTGTDDHIAHVWFQPTGTTDSSQRVSARNMFKNAPITGTFSAGALMANASSYYVNVEASQGTTIIVDNIRILRQDISPITNQPANWVLLPWTPYPRLGNYLLGTTTAMAKEGFAEGTPYTYSVDKIEDRLAYSDIVVGPDIGNQTFRSAFVRRLKQRNPGIIVLPYRIAWEQTFPESGRPADATIDPKYDFMDAVAEEWIVTTTNGDPVIDPVWNIHQMNISEFCPVIDGQTFASYLINWTVDTVMASGTWDGIFFDNLFDRFGSHDPALLDYDINRNGLRDETPASLHEIYRSASRNVLQQIRAEVGDLELVMGNTGCSPAISLSPYVNGYLFECWDEAWLAYWHTEPSEAGWKRALDEYFAMQANAVPPRINVIEGCGRGSSFTPDRSYLEPTEEDIQAHRFTLGTALLGDGFYEYDLFDSRSAPYWFDEYTVDRNGVAVEDRQQKGYLGLALGNAVELTTTATLVWEQDFETGVLPPEMWAGSGVYVSQAASDVISGTSSLVIDNPDHTQMAYVWTGTDPSKVVLAPGETYMVGFDWKILETLDGYVETGIGGSGGGPDPYRLPGKVTGDVGKARFPLTLLSGSNFSIGFTLGEGGGKVAIDSIRVTQGGAGPWRRDFENGFVLVNPLNRPYIFDASELVGSLNRTGIKRILGTQAPAVNNGQPVTDTLTLQPFDAIILLANCIPSDDQLIKNFLPLVLKGQ